MTTRAKNTINIVKWIFTFGIVFYHCNYPNNVGLSFWSYCYRFLKDNANMEVFAFSIISGFLFYYNVDDMNDIFVKMRKRVKSLVIPYFLWNVIGIIYNLIYANRHNLNLGTLFISFKSTQWFNQLVLGAAQPQFWCVFMLILMTAIAPLIYTLKNKGALYICAFTVLIYLIANGGCILVSRATYIVYIIGAIIGLHWQYVKETVGGGVY